MCISNALGTAIDTKTGPWQCKANMITDGLDMLQLSSEFYSGVNTCIANYNYWSCLSGCGL